MRKFFRLLFFSIKTTLAAKFVLVIFFSVMPAAVFSAPAGFPFGLGSSGADFGKDIAVDSDNNFYVTGMFQGTFDFDPSKESDFKLTSQGNPEQQGSTDIFVAKYSSNGAFIWAYSLGSNETDVVNTIRIANDGSLLITGYFGGRIDFDPSPTAEKWLDAGNGRDAFIAKYDIDFRLKWAYKFGDQEQPPFETDDQRYEEAFDLDVDLQGNVILCGTFNGTIDIDPTDGGKPSDTFSSVVGLDELPSRDIFIVSLTASGAFRWGFTLGGKGHDQAQAVRFASDGSIFAGGLFNQQCDFNPDPNQSKNLSSSGLYDCFLAKYKADGSFEWAFKMGSISRDQIRPGAMVVDGNNNVYVGGDFSGNTNFNPNGFDRLSSKGSGDAFIAKYSASGDYVWALGFGADRQDFVQRLCISGGNVYAVGSYGGAVDFDPAELTEMILVSKGSQSAYDGFLAKYTLDGTPVFASGFGCESISGDDWTIASGVAADNTNHIYLTGRFYQKAFFYPNDFSLLSAGSSDILISKYRTDGTMIANNSSVENAPATTCAEIYPNPAYERISIIFNDLPPEKIYVLNLLGETKAVLNTANATAIEWETRDFAGKPLSAGLYILKMEYKERIESAKLVIIE